MAKKKPTTKSKKDNKKKRKILLATLIPVGALVAATAITVPTVIALNRNKGNEDDPIAYKKAVVLKNTGNVKGTVTLSRPHGEGEEIKQYQANLQYSTDGKNWTTPTYTYTEGDFETCSCDIEPNATLFIKGDNNAMVYWDEQHERRRNMITITQQDEWSQENHASIELSGSIMGLIDDGGTKPKPDWTMPINCFQLVFCVEEGVPALTSVSKDFLSSEQIVNKLSDSCFMSLFANCSHLKNSPNLPSTKLAVNCYASMFEMWGESSDFDAPPELPAEELESECYSGMFYGCASLKEAPKLPAKKLAYRCYNAMFQGCTSLKKLKSSEQEPVLPASTFSGADGCYYNMFSGCASLKIIENGPQSSTKKIIFICPELQMTQEVYGMFADTGGTFKGTPTTGDTYYYEVQE